MRMHNQELGFAKFVCFLCYMLISISHTTCQRCDNTAGNFTTNSTYSNNRNFILSYLASNASAKGGFYNATFGQDADQIYALALCGGATSPETCASCVNDSVQTIMTNCPNQKQAYLWGGSFCLVRYSNSSFFEKLELDPSIQLYNTGDVKTNLTQFNLIWESLMDRIVKRASTSSSGLKYATEEANLTNFEKIYALMQCTSDVSEIYCDYCLRQSVAAYQTCCGGKRGGVVERPSCYFRWDLYPFYNSTAGTPALSPPPAAPLPSPPDPPATSTNSNDSRGIAAGTVVIIVVSAVFFMAIVAITCIFLRRRKRKQEIRSNLERNADDINKVESLQFDFSTIRDATNNFSVDNKLGQGGFGAVYKGRLPDGQEIAVKRLSKSSGQGELEFKNEVVLVKKLQHRNLVRLLGFCFEGTERLLIYECVPNSSLDKYIFDPVKRLALDWENRYKIIGGIARGILYLHEDSRLRIIHRDLKASNILLDADMNPKISDFGMARLFEMDQTQGDTSRIVGTFGYMAPEYVMRGQFSVKSDVFSFGVLVLEIISGQKNTCFHNGEETEELLTYAWKNWREGTALNLVDPTLKVGSTSTEELIRSIHMGLLCVQENVANRPTMASIVLMLNSYSLSLPVPSRPAFFMHTTTVQDNLEFTASDQSKSGSVQFSVNEASITELDPR